MGPLTLPLSEYCVESGWVLARWCVNSNNPDVAHAFAPQPNRLLAGVVDITPSTAAPACLNTGTIPAGDVRAMQNRVTDDIATTTSAILQALQGRCAPKGFQQRLVLQEGDVLDMVVCLVLPLDLLPRLPRVNALEDAELPADSFF